MNFIEMLNYFIGLIHTLIRFLPLGVYFFTYFSSALYKDLRTAILLIGLIINDLIGYIFNKYFSTKLKRDACSIFGKEGDKSPGFLINPHTEIMSFICGFYFSDMYYKQKLDNLPFIFLLTMLFLTIWSRVTIGCKNMKDVGFYLITGLMFGVIYYYFVSKYYLEAEKGKLEKETCELGYNNYRCDEIKDGTVIIKDNSQNNSNDEGAEDGGDDEE